MAGMWQLHFSEAAGTAHHASAEHIANLQGPDVGNYLELTAQPTRDFTIFNWRTNKVNYYDYGEASSAPQP
jgi:hypothetical protein